MFDTTRARRRARRLAVDRLEGRDVPASVADPLFTIPGEVAAPRDPDWVQMHVQPAGSDRVLLSVEVEPGDGSALRPGRVGVFAGDGARAWAVGPAGRPGFALKEVSSGTVFARVAGAAGSTGAFDLAVGLAGDVTGDRQVTAEDLDLIRGLYGVRAGRDGFNAAADVNHNGVIGPGDLRLARRNLGVSADVGPLTADRFLFAGSAALGLTGRGPRAFDPATAPDISLVVDGITDPAAIKADAFSWGVSNPGGIGRPTAADLHVVMPPSAASPKLFLACAEGTHIPDVELLIGRRVGTKGVPYLHWKLENVRITSYSVSGSDGGGNVNLSETMSLNFTRITVTFHPRLPNGRAGDPVTASFDFGIES